MLCHVTCCFVLSLCLVVAPLRYWCFFAAELLGYYFVISLLVLSCPVVGPVLLGWFCLVYYIVDVALSHSLCCPIVLLALFCKN
jgi:hypothetical protein